jgi:hypothetical protein
MQEVWIWILYVSNNNYYTTFIEYLMEYHKMLNLKVTSSLFSKLVVVIFGQKIYLKSMVLMLNKTKVSPFLLHCFH